MSSAEAAEFAKLADTTYRDVNIALANEFARYADRVGVDIHEVIAAANSQPYSHIHQPGLGVGGHCIPVYPHFLLDRAPGAGARRAVAGGSTTARSAWRSEPIQQALGGLEGVPVLVLGPDLPRRGQGAGLLAGAAADRAAGARRRRRARAYDPLLTADEIARAAPRRGPGARPRPMSGRSSPRPRTRCSGRSTRRGSRTSRCCSTAGTASRGLALPEASPTAASAFQGAERRVDPAASAVP